MKIKYNNRPPVIETNVPHYLFKRDAKTIINRLIAWAQKEYYDAMIELYATTDIPTARYYEEHYTYLDVLGTSTTFKSIVPMINEDVWNKFDRKTQDVLIGANNIMVSGSRG